MNWVWPIAPAHEPLHVARRDVALLEDRQRRDQLVAEIVALIMDEGEAGEGADHRIAAGEGAESVSMPQTPIITPGSTP